MRWSLCAIGAVSVIFSSSIQTASCFRLGGGGRQANSQQQKKPDTSSSLTPDDPLVNASTPPPPEAKMLTKVGWCEVQVLGHTCSEFGLVSASLPWAQMHLSERLKQLSRKLNFEPEKSGIQLMDDVDALVKYVSANKKDAAPIKSSPQAPVAPAK